MQLLSDEYLQLLREKHLVKPWGGQGHSWVPHLTPLIEELKIDTPITVLDYGCGRGTLKAALEQAMPTVTVNEYDPGIPEKSALPDRADIVVCTDVMEHVEEKFLAQTLKYLAQLTSRRCFMVIACSLSYSLLPDGRNAHITVHPPEWWHECIKLAFPKQDFEMRVYERKAGRTIVGLTRR